MLQLILPLLIPAAAALIAAAVSVWHYTTEDVPRAIYWLLLAIVAGQWFMSNLDYQAHQDR